MCETLIEADTGLHADSVEFCPVPGYQDLLAGGTYQLDEEKQQRFGELKLYRLNQSKRPINLDTVFSAPCHGILDMKWSPHPSCDVTVIGTVDAVGSLNLFKLDGNELTRLQQFESEGSCIALSLDWSSRRSKSANPHIAVSYSNGQVAVFRLSSDLELLKTIKCSDFEAWITAFNYWNDDVVYTGGDDCLFQGYDLRIPTTSPIFKNRAHEMGVCSMHCNPHTEHLLATGSYDEHIRFWDARKISKSPISQIRVGGGVWRIKWSPHNLRDLLAACMHNGFAVAKYGEGSGSVVATYGNHDSLAYGADWCYAPGSGSNTVASCSFYDHKLCVWRWST